MAPAITSPKPKLLFAALTLMCIFNSVHVSAALIRDCQDICEAGPCGPGSYYSDSQKACLPCTAGSFMSCSNHGCKNCSICVPANDRKLKVFCNSTANMVTCNDGFFKAVNGPPVAKNCWSCKICSANEVELSPCTSESDRICRENEEPRLQNVSGVDEDISRPQQSTPYLFPGGGEGSVTSSPESTENYDQKIGLIKEGSTNNVIIVVTFASVIACVAMIILIYMFLLLLETKTVYVSIK